MLFAKVNGRRGFDFTGRLSFDWPAGDCLPQQGGFQFRRGLRSIAWQKLEDRAIAVD